MNEGGAKGVYRRNVKDISKDLRYDKKRITSHDVILQNRLKN